MRAEGKRYVPRAADGQDIIIHSVIHMIQGVSALISLIGRSRGSMLVNDTEGISQ
jgi:hypothetical protein